MERGARGQGFIRGVRAVPTRGDVQEAAGQVPRNTDLRSLARWGLWCFRMNLQPQESHLMGGRKHRRVQREPGNLEEMLV